MKAFRSARLRWRRRLRFRQRAAAGGKQLKMQSTWPASLTLQDNFRFFADRVDKLTSGQVKIEAMAAGQIVPPFEILDATHKKVIDGGHGIAYYWVGKNKAATLSWPRPRASPGWITWITRLDVRGGRARHVVGLLSERAQAERDCVPDPAGEPQALGWFKRPIKDLKDFKE